MLYYSKLSETGLMPFSPIDEIYRFQCELEQDWYVPKVHGLFSNIICLHLQASEATFISGRIKVWSNALA